jgi:hypothetical protein
MLSPVQVQILVFRNKEQQGAGIHRLQVRTSEHMLHIIERDKNEIEAAKLNVLICAA